MTFSAPFGATVLGSVIALPTGQFAWRNHLRARGGRQARRKHTTGNQP